MKTLEMVRAHASAAYVLSIRAHIVGVDGVHVQKLGTAVQRLQI
jgi:hypothetical protein